MRNYLNKKYKIYKNVHNNIIHEIRTLKQSIGYSTFGKVTCNIIKQWKRAVLQDAAAYIDSTDLLLSRRGPIHTVLFHFYNVHVHQN